MRASTLLGLALAVIVGLVAVAGVRMSGILNRAEAHKVEPVLVLAARQNLYADTAATTANVGLRPATPAELAFLQKYPEKAMPPTPEAAHLRVLVRNVMANDMLLKGDFQEMTLPVSIKDRMSPGMRAVDVEVPKDRAAAGLLRLGEHVDVYLTSKVCTDSSGSQPRTAIAAIARDLKIIVKRDALYTLMIPVPEDKPVSYILEANPYRAALIEFSKSKGLITLVATSSHANGHNGAADKEQQLVNHFENGGGSVSEADLERIFHMSQLQAIPQPIRVETWNGTQKGAVVMVQPPIPIGAGESGYSFFMPGEASQFGAKLDGAKKDAAPNNIGTKPGPTKNSKK